MGARSAPPVGRLPLVARRPAPLPRPRPRAGSRASAGVVTAYLFGSLADRTDHAESDVDVAVLLDHGAFTRDALLRYADVRPFLERTRRLKLQTLAR